MTSHAAEHEVLRDPQQRASLPLLASAAGHRLAARAFSILGFRWLVAGCQAATLLMTWPLWQVHQTPPMLPALALPPVDVGVALLLSLVLTRLRPLAGVTLHTVLVLYAILIDQTRLQPEVISLVFLLWGSLGHLVAQAFGRAHLISLWLFAGLNKLFSPAFMDWPSRWLLESLVPNPPVVWCDAAGRCTADPQVLATMRAFNVPLPPEHRLLEGNFDRSCQPGDWMTIKDTRWWAARQGFDHRVLTCPGGS